MRCVSSANNFCAFCRENLAEQERRFVAREMQFGMAGEFEYCQCNSCGSLNLQTIPADLSRFYPANYYSYNIRRGTVKRMMRLARKYRDRYAISGKGVAGRLLYRLVPKNPLGVLAPIGIDCSWRVLDIGAGDGDFVLRLRDAGFTNAIGVDPFVRGDIKERDATVVAKCDLDDMAGLFDLITFNHSLEHMLDPTAALESAIALMAEGGMLLVQIPLADSYGFRTFANAWHALDAPRHVFLPSAPACPELRTGWV